MKNLCFYLDKYNFDEQYQNLYYYQFHLIFFILTAIKEFKGQNLLREDIMKFYFHHIVHFFVNEKNCPEKKFFFYIGAFKLQKKKYNIKTEFVIDLKSEFTIPNTIHNIFSKIYEELPYKKITLSPKETEFLDLFDTIINKVSSITNKIISFKKKFSKNKNFFNSYENLTETFNFSLQCIDDILKLLKDYEVECEELIKYKEFIQNFIDLNSIYKLTYNHLILMELNNNKISLIYNKYDIEKYIFILNCIMNMIHMLKKIIQIYSEILLIQKNSKNYT